MKISEIIVGRTYSNGKIGSREVHRKILAISQGKVDVKYIITYADSSPVCCGIYTCRLSTFAKWAKVDVT